VSGSPWAASGSSYHIAYAINLRASFPLRRPGNALAEASDRNVTRYAKTAFLVYRSHLETDHQLLSGCREDVLRNINGAWKVRRRTIVLDANVLLDRNLSVFL
jgi:hypothetical protein